jgi:predicted DNA-binding protein
MKKEAEGIRFQLVKTLPPLGELKHGKGFKLDSYVKSLCLEHSSPMLYLVPYLASLGLPLSNGREIMEALEHPIYWKKMSSFVARAWKFYLDDKGEHFRLNYLNLLTAEAWLRADTERKHGGKRREELLEMQDTDIQKNIGITLPLSLELYTKLEDLAKSKGMTNMQLVLEALETYIEDLEDIKTADAVMKGVEEGTIKIISSEEMVRRLGLDS